MPEITKPSNLSLTWASGGDILDPGNSKYAQGWEVEIPPRQWFNFIDNRQDGAIAHINQHGIAVWDNATEYQAAKSYVQGSDGNIYRAINTTTGINPVGDGGVNWQSLFLTRLATALEAQGWTNNLTLLSPGRLADAFKGSNQNLASSGFQRIPGGQIMQWTSLVSGSAAPGSTPFTWPFTFPTAIHSAIAVEVGTAATSVSTIKLINITAAGGSLTHVFATGAVNPSVHIFGIGS